MLDNRVWIEVRSHPIDLHVQDRPAEEGEVEEDRHHEDRRIHTVDQDQNQTVGRNHAVDRNHVADQDQIYIYENADRLSQRNGRRV